MSSPSNNQNQEYEDRNNYHQSSFQRTPPMYNVMDNFVPMGYSSPLKTNFGSGGSRSFSGRNQQSQQGFSARFNKNNSFNNFNNRNKPYHNRSGGGWHGNGNNKRSDHEDVDINAYFHPSMLEDPWKHLEKKQGQKRKSDFLDVSETVGKPFNENSDTEVTTQSDSVVVEDQHEEEQAPSNLKEEIKIDRSELCK